MNSVILIGRLTKDPELRYIPESQTAVANFIIAVDRPNTKDKTDFIRIQCFGKVAENCERFLVKSRLVGVQGRLQTGSYKNKEGATVYTADVVGDRIEFLEWGDKAATGSGGRTSGSGTEIPEGFQVMEDSDDDIPF